MTTTLEAEIAGRWDYGDPAGSERRFRELLESGGYDQAQRAEIVTQVARAQGLQRAFDAAHATLDDVAAQREALPPRVVARYLLERGRVYNSSGASGEARPLFEEAWELARAHGELYYAIDAAHMLAIVAPPGDAGGALAWNLRALELAEQAQDERARGWRASLLNNIGWGYHDAGDYAAALAHFERALAAREEQGQVAEARIARWCVGRALRSLGRLEEALAIQRALREEHEQSGGQDGFVDEELGELLLLTEGAAAARPFFASAYALLSQDQWLVAEEPARLARLRALGEGGASQ